MKAGPKVLGCETPFCDPLLNSKFQCDSFLNHEFQSSSVCCSGGSTPRAVQHRAAAATCISSSLPVPTSRIGFVSSQSALSNSGPCDHRELHAGVTGRVTSANFCTLDRRSFVLFHGTVLVFAVLWCLLLQVVTRLIRLFWNVSLCRVVFLVSTPCCLLHVITHLLGTHRLHGVGHVGVALCFSCCGLDLVGGKDDILWDVFVGDTWK